MGKKFLIDTNVVIYHLNDVLTGDGRAMLMSILKIECNLSVISKIELFSWSAPENAAEQMRTFVQYCTVYPLTDDIAEKAAELRRTYKKFALPDAIIAATALVHNLTLVSRNDADFQRIKKLKYTNPFNI
jgi:predicted nucleic acid-binding protein